MQLTRLSLCIVLTTALAAAGNLNATDELTSDDSAHTSALSAQDILGRSVETYLSCRSYRDSGLVHTVIFNSDEKRVVDKPFKTVFNRDGRFRFQFFNHTMISRKQLCIVWTDGENVLTWWDVKPGIQPEDSLSSAIAGATGVSGRSAHTVPILLMPDRINGRSIADMTDLDRLEDELVESVRCFKISGDYANLRQTLWVDQTTFLIRQIEMEIPMKGFRAKTTTTYEPAIDADIPKGDFAFNSPPGG